MTVKNITITSKNQITLPAEFVRKLEISPSRRISIRRRGNELILKPETTEDVLVHFSKHWKHQAGKKPLNDEELKQAIRDSVVAAWDEKDFSGK